MKENDDVEYLLPTARREHQILIRAYNLKLLSQLSQISPLWNPD